MAFSPQIFLSNVVQHGGLARTNRFRVIMNLPPGVTKFIDKSTFDSFMESVDSTVGGAINTATSVLSKLLGGQDGPPVPRNDSSASRYLSLQCETTELPGRSVLTQEIDIYGPVYKRPYKAAYGEIPFTFVCTNDFYEKKLFDVWMESMVPTDTHNVRYAKSESNQRQYTSDVVIVQYDDFIKQIYAVKLIDAFPVSVSPMGLNWSDDGFHRLSVQFAYTKYELITNLQYDFPNASDIFGAIGTRILGGLTL